MFLKIGMKFDSPWGRYVVYRVHTNGLVDLKTDGAWGCLVDFCLWSHPMVAWFDPDPRPAMTALWRFRR